MAAVQWDGTEKVIDQRCHTVTLTDDVMPNHMSFKNNNIDSPKQKKKQNAIGILKFSNILLQNSR